MYLSPDAALALACAASEEAHTRRKRNTTCKVKRSKTDLSS